MSNAIHLDPIFSTPQILLLIVAAVALAIRLYRRALSGEAAARRIGTALVCLRVAAVAAIAALLLNPVVTQTNKETAKPPLLILLDASHSMAIPDAEGQTRFDAARAATIEDREWMQSLNRLYNCRLFRMTDTAAPQDVASFLQTAKPDGRHTHIGEALASALGSVPSASSGGVLLVSDGRNNGEADPVTAAHLARERRFPVFTVCLGSAKEAADVAVINRRPQVFAIPQQRVSLTAEIRSAGFNGQTAQVDLLRDGKPAQTRSVPLDEHKPVPLSFEVRENGEGTYKYAISVRPMPNEQTTSNNRCTVLLQVLKSKARVLVLEGRPTWDAKFLVRALQTDPSIDVDAIYKITNDKYFAIMGASQTSGQPVAKVKIPKTPEELAKYDVIVIGKGYEGFFEPADTEALKKFVSEHSGNLVFLRGRPDERTEALRDLEPIQWSSDQISEFRLQVTEEGQRNPAFNFSGSQSAQDVVQKLPTMVSATKVVGEKALSVVLARASGVASEPENREMAVLAYQNYGQGKVLSLVGEGLWRWALLPPDLKDYSRCYSDFWTQLVRWMINQSDFLPGQDVVLKTDHPTYTLGDAVSLMAYVRGKAKTELPPITITHPDGASSKIALGKVGASQADFAGTFRPQQPGEYLAGLSRPNAGMTVVPFTVSPDSEEELVTGADPELMRQIAREGGGEALSPASLKDLPDKLRHAQMTLATKTASHGAWNQGWVLGLLLLLLVSEWVLRRRAGLL